MSDLSNSIKNAANALLLVAEEADKIEKEIANLQALIGKHESFNSDLQMVFSKYYGGI